MKEENLDQLRHTAAHLLAAAVVELWPETKRAIGPAIEEGFYYDFDFKEPIGEADLPKIEKKMREIVRGWETMQGSEVGRDEAEAMFEAEPYKLELIEEFAEEGKKLSVYKSGNYVDLCAGNHVEKPRDVLKYFKLLSVAGAYWRGDEKNKMLTRIYGTAFFDESDLKEYLRIREEAKARDHKKLGKELHLFTFSDLVGTGLPLWTPEGTIIRNELDGLVWKLRKARGYKKVTIPHITKKDLYITSGHWDKFADELFRIKTREGHEFAIKPMNCPHHTQIFASDQRSYRDMPQRYAETTMVYRDEQTGELSGLSRVRCITQDDAHVFCRETQVIEEANAIWDIIETFYKATGFGNLKVRLSLHDPEQMENYLGDRETWEMAENQLRDLIKKRGVEFEEVAGEAAFYGPKVDFMTRDSLGREWQVATIQVDRNMPERFGLNCINEEGNEERVVMLHAAIMGSLERFISILIEHHAGEFPVWLAPVQVRVLPVSEKFNDYANRVKSELEKMDIRIDVDDSNESLGKKIRNGEKMKVPMMMIVGEKEESEEKVSIRGRKEKDMGAFLVNDAGEMILKKIDEWVKD